MKRKGKSVLALLLAVFLLFNSIDLQVFAQTTITVTDGPIVSFATPHYTVKVDKTGFRYGFYRPDGTVIADMHAVSGICFGKTGSTPFDAQSSTYIGMNGDTANFTVTNTNGDVADVGIQMFDNYVKFSIAPQAGSGIMQLTSSLPQTLTVQTQAASLSAPVTLPATASGAYLHVLGAQDTLNATVNRMVTPGLTGDYTIESDVKIDTGMKNAVGIYAHYNASNAFHLFYIKAGTTGTATGTAAIGLKRLDPTATVDLGTASITPEGSAKAISAGTWYHLKMVVQGRTIQCYIDGVLVFNANDTAATNAQIQGGCGIRTDKGNASFDNIQVLSNDGASAYTQLDFEDTSDIGTWTHLKWNKMMGSSGVEHIAADSTVTPIPAYDPNVNTYLYVKPSSLTAASAKELTNSNIPSDNYTMEARVRFDNATPGTSSSGIFAHESAKNAMHLFFLKNGSTSLKRLNADGTSVSLGDNAMTSIAGSKWYRLKLVAAGKSLKCYINDQLIFDGNDTGASAEALLGKCGLRVYKDNASIDDIKIYSNSDPTNIYYQNDFDGKTLANISGDFKEISDINATDGTDKTTMELKTESRSDNPDGSLVDKYLYLNASSLTSAVVTAGSAWTDYTVSADTSFTASDEMTSESLVMRYTDANNYYRFGFLKSGYVSLIKKVAGVETVFADVPFTYNYGTYYNLKATLAGGVITGYVNNTQVLQATDSQFAGGTAGVMANVTTAKVNNFAVTGGATFSDSFEGDLANWTVTGSGIISYDGDPAQNPSQPTTPTVQKYTIDARVQGGINPMYGLGDYGAVGNSDESVRTTSNVYGVNRTALGSFTNKDGGFVRFISNFSVSPHRGFAQVLFEEADKRVVINDTETMLGVYSTDKVTSLYYFFGDMQQIYQDYRNVRNQEGYKDTKPHYSMFGLGWEAFGALGWNAYQANVQSTVQDYLNEGYNITWAVIGSGFWKGDRSGLEGTTTSFGMWDDTADPAGRNDTAQGMPNPRFPDPAGIKTFFKNNDIKLLLGLRVHLKLPTELGGDWNPLVDGNFVQDALANNYFIKNEDGSLLTLHAKYPSGNRSKLLVSYVDGSNPAAAEWYRQQASLWGVDGFKEDTMVLNGDLSYHDGNWNRLLSYMIDHDNDVMIMRNGAYSLSGDILRINDANFGTNNNTFNYSPDRMPINVLAYAASGVSNAYPDIVGGTGGNINDTTFQKYLVRNAQFAALNPSMSVGINALKMNNEDYKAATFNAINFHSTYAPYIYDAALKSWETGYPTSMTPLYIAYPDDANTGNMINTTARQYEWMLGESLLAAPLFGTDFNLTDSRDVYLPAGKWIDYSTGETFQGPVTLTNRDHPISNVPAFVGGKGVLVGEDMQNKGHYFTEVFPIANNGSTYDYTFIDGTTKSQIVNNNVGWSPSTLKVTDTTANKGVTFIYNSVNKSIKFAFEAGHNYVLTGGEDDGSLASATTAVSKQKLAIGQTGSVSVTSGVLGDGSAANLSNASYSYKTSDGSVVGIDSSTGTITALKEGTAQVWADVTLNNNQGQPVTISSNKVTVEVAKPAVSVTSPFCYSNDFSNSDISGWNNLAAAGNYSVDSSTGALKYSGAGKTERGVILQGNASWTDYTVESDVTIPTQGATGKTIGIVLRYKGANQNYILGYTEGTGLRYIKRNGDTASPPTDSATVPYTLTPGQTYHFKVVAKGNTFKFYVDDVTTPKLSVTDNAPVVPAYTSGSAGLYASGMDVSFDNFKVSSLVDSMPLTVSGTSFGADKIHLNIWHLDTTVVPDTQGNWTYNVGYIPSGSHTLLATVEDASGAVLASDTKPVEAVGIPEQLDKSALQSALDNANAEKPAASGIGDCDGQYQQAAVTTFLNAISAAQQAYDTVSTAEQVQSAAQTLNDITTAFKASKITVDRSALAAVIASANQKIFGQYTADSKAALQQAINSAQTIYDTTLVTQAQVNDAASALQQAINALAALPDNSSSNPGSGNTSSGSTSSGGTSSGDTSSGGQESSPQLLTDSSTGVKVLAPAGVLPPAAQLEVKNVTTGTNFEMAADALDDVSGKIQLFDISLLLNGQKIQPQSGSVTVSIPIPQGFDRSKLALYHVADDGKRTELPFTIDGDNIVFTTTHFSYYAIADTSVPGSAADTPATGEDPIGIIPPAALLFLSGMTIVYSKKKKRS